LTAPTPRRFARGSRKRPNVRLASFSDDRTSEMADSTSLPRPRHVARAASQLLLGREGRIGSTLYGTMIVLTALTASYAGERHDPWKLVELVVSAVVVFWLAYVYAHALSESIESRSRLSRRGVSSVASRELGLMLAAVAPIVALLLGAVGLINERESIWLAIAFGFVTLSAQGVRYARVAGLGRRGTALILLLNLVFGAVIVVLKVTLVH